MPVSVKKPLDKKVPEKPEEAVLKKLQQFLEEAARTLEAASRRVRVLVQRRDRPAVSEESFFGVIVTSTSSSAGRRDTVYTSAVTLVGLEEARSL